MRWALALVAVMIFAIPAAMAAKPKDAPKPNAVAKAGDKVTFDKDKACTYKFAGNKVVKFTPADIGHLNDEERSKGCIIGKLETERDTKGGLKAGTYRVYMRKPVNHWEVYFAKQDDVVDQAEVTQGLENEHDPRFMEGGNAIRYFTIKFTY